MTAIGTAMLPKPFDVLADRSAAVVRREHEPDDAIELASLATASSMNGRACLYAELDPVARHRAPPRAGRAAASVMRRNGDRPADGVVARRRSSSCSSVGGRPRRMCV